MGAGALRGHEPGSDTGHPTRRPNVRSMARNRTSFSIDWAVRVPDSAKAEITAPARSSGAGAVRSAAAIAAGHALVQNLRRGDYELVTEVPPPQRLTAARLAERDVGGRTPAE